MLPRFPFACLPGVAALAFDVDSEASEYAVLTGEEEEPAFAEK